MLEKSEEIKANMNDEPFKRKRLIEPRFIGN
jgi:hypothetical protein